MPGPWLMISWMAGTPELAGISAARSAMNWLCWLVASTVNPAMPSDPETRWAMLLTGLPELEYAAGIADNPAVMIGIMARPLPMARMQVHRTTSCWVMFGLIPHSR